MSDIVAQENNYLNRTTRLIAGGDDDDDNDDQSDNFDVGTDPTILTVFSPLIDKSITAINALASQEGTGVMAIGGNNAGTGVYGKGGGGASLPSPDLKKDFGIGVYGQSGET